MALREYVVLVSPQGEFRVIKLGFSWLALLFTLPWSISNGLWRAALIAIAIESLGCIVFLAGYEWVAITFLILLKIPFAYYFNHWIVAKLANQRYMIVCGPILAASQKHALLAGMDMYSPDADEEAEQSDG